MDPLEVWQHDPFDACIETGADGAREIRARGAWDDKGQMMAFVEACRAWKVATGKLPIPISILIAGFFGSAAANPNHVLARILTDLHDADGRVTVPGFYDGVSELPEMLKKQWATLNFRSC